MRFPQPAFFVLPSRNRQEYVFSVESRTQPSVRDLKNRLLKHEDVSSSFEYQLVPSCGGSALKDEESLWRVGLSGRRHLHLVAHRSSKIHFKSADKGRSLELTLQASAVFADDDVTTSSFLEDNAAFPRLIQPLSEGQRLIEEVQCGLASGYAPALTEEGTGGTYFMSNRDGQRIAVFKPVDEEPLAVNNPRGMTPSETGEGLKAGTRVGEGAFREVAAYVLDHNPSGVDKLNREGFSGVPLTVLACCSDEHFSSNSSNERWRLDGLPTVKQGSLQKFVHAVSNCEDMGPQHFPVHEVHKIAVLDMRMGNADRNGANILVQKEGSAYTLTPIDHGYCLPETVSSLCMGFRMLFCVFGIYCVGWVLFRIVSALNGLFPSFFLVWRVQLEECTFEWLYWSQAKVAFDPQTLAYIKALDPDADVELLKLCGWNLSEGAARTLRSCTTLLQKGADAGLTPFQIGSMMVRSDPSRASVLEGLVEEAEALLDCNNLSADTFSSVLSGVIDSHLAAGCR